MASKKIKEQFDNYYRLIKEFDLEKVFRKNLGNYTFSNEEKFNHILEILDGLDTFSEQTGNKIVTQGIDSMRQLYDFYVSIRDLSDPQFIQNLEKNRTQFDNIYNDMLDIVPFLKMLSGNSDKNLDLSEALSDTITEFNKNVDESKTLKSKLENELETLDERYKTLFTKAEVINQSQIFKKEADNYRLNSYWWLFAIIISILLFSLLLKYIMKNFCFELSCFAIEDLKAYKDICPDCGKNILMLEIIKAILYRTLIIGLGIYLINFCVKNYNNSMHNKTINIHKQNSLEAALVLIEKTSESGKDEIISLAAQAIFQHQKTGYLSKEGNQVSPFIFDQILNKTKE